MASPVRVLTPMWRLTRGGGIQIVVRRIARSVDPTEVELHVAIARELPIDDVDAVGVHVHRLGVSDPWTNLGRMRTAIGVARVARRIRPRVIHLHSGTAWMGLLARLTSPRCRFVLEVHDAPGSGRHGRFTDVVEGWWPRFLGATALCHSSSVEAECRRLWRVPPDRLKRFPLAVDLEVFTPSAGREGRLAWRRERGIPEGLPLAVTVGRLARSKRFDKAVRAVAQLRRSGAEVGLVVVGDGQQRDELERIARDEGVADVVWFTGALFDRDLAAALHAVDILCSPSEYEGFGLTIIEGMAAGLPSVAVEVGGVSDLVVDGTTGFLVAPEDDAGFAKRLQELVEDPERRGAMGAAGRARAEELYSNRAAAARFAELYRTV